MVKTSLINLVNLRTKDLHWWNNGKKFLKSINNELRVLKEKDDLLKDSHDSKAALDEFIKNAKSTDSNMVLNSITNLMKFYTLKYGEETSRKLVKDQLNLFRNSLKDIKVRKAFDEALCLGVKNNYLFKINK